MDFGGVPQRVQREHVTKHVLYCHNTTFPSNGLNQALLRAQTQIYKRQYEGQNTNSSPIACTDSCLVVFRVTRTLLGKDKWYKAPTGAVDTFVDF